MKIEPGMLCELLPGKSNHIYGAYVNTAVEAIYPATNPHSNKAGWIVRAEDGVRFGAVTERLRPLSPPPMPAKEVERELVV